MSARHDSVGLLGRNTERKIVSPPPARDNRSGQEAAARQKTEKSTDVVSPVFKKDPRNCGEAAMQRKKKDERKGVVRKELDVLE